MTLGVPVFLIPILSPKSDLNTWFSPRGMIESFYPSDGGCTIVLANGQMITSTFFSKYN